METPYHPVEEIDRQQSNFARRAHAATIAAGSGGAVAGVVVAAFVWLALGLATGFSRPWELGITVGAPFLTLLLVVVVQHTQNHNNRAIQLKLDELILAIEGPHHGMVGIEEGSRTDLEHLQAQFQRGDPREAE
jgi:low affinity Fe/Cu permease